MQYDVDFMQIGRRALGLRGSFRFNICHDSVFSGESFKSTLTSSTPKEKEFV